MTKTRNTRILTFVVAAVLALLTGFAGLSAAQDGSEAVSLGPVAEEHSLFEGVTPEAVIAADDDRAVELGVRFAPKVSGLIVGVRIYQSRASESATPDSASLWTDRGRLLATVPVSPREGAGWVTVRFDSAVPVDPERTYVASYHAPYGKYAASHYFFNQAYENDYLAAPAGYNGVYEYDPDSEFPAHSYRRTNYWVDPILAVLPASPTGSGTTGPSSDPTTNPTSAEPTSAEPSSVSPSTPSGSTGSPSESDPTTETPTEPTEPPTSTAPSTTGPTSPSATEPSGDPTDPTNSGPTSASPTEPPPTTTSVTPSATSTPTTTPDPGGWPGPDNTGVPAGTTLTRYTGPCTITSTRTLNAVDATNCDALLIRAPNVVITNSLTPRIDATAAGDASVTITDSTVNAGNWTDGAIWGYNFTATRVEVTGGQHSVHCNDNCTLVDSWLHDQYNPDGEGYHNNAFISNGGTNMLIRHNTLHCTAILNSTDGGCTADLSLFGDFDPITHVTVDANLFKANNSSISYCAYGGYSPSKPYPVAEYIVFTNNVFERGPNRRCGVFGAITSFDPGATGNRWSGNMWDDRTVLNP